MCCPIAYPRFQHFTVHLLPKSFLVVKADQTDVLTKLCQPDTTGPPLYDVITPANSTMSVKNCNHLYTCHLYDVHKACSDGGAQNTQQYQVKYHIN